MTLRSTSRTTSTFVRDGIGKVESVILYKTDLVNESVSKLLSKKE